MGFLIPPEEIICVAMIRKFPGIDEIKIFYDSLYHFRFKYTTKLDWTVGEWRTTLGHQFNPETHFVMGFNDMSAFIAIKLAHPDRIHKTWFKDPIK